MVRYIGISRFITYMVWLGAILAIVLYLHGIPALKAVSYSVTGLGLVLALAGQTPLFPWLCRRVPLKYWLPDLDGSYRAEISSNWSRIEGREVPQIQSTPDLEFEELNKRAGICRLKAKLFSIEMSLEMEDRYLHSEVVECALLPATAGSKPCLVYVYKSVVENPETTDSATHMGAACLHVDTSKPISEIAGHYWTDRNWHQGRNTAGHIRLLRVP